MSAIIAILGPLLQSLLGKLVELLLFKVQTKITEDVDAIIMERKKFGGVSVGTMLDGGSLHLS